MGKWKMPEWMEPYRGCIANTGGNSIERLMNGPPATVQVNAPLALIQMSVEAQIEMLHRLKKEGWLR